MVDTIQIPSQVLSAAADGQGSNVYTLQRLRNFIVSVCDWAALGATSASLVSAAGTTQGTATVLSTSCNIVTTVASDTGVLLLSELYIVQRVRNAGANPLNVYPASGIAIELLASNAPVVLATGSTVMIANASSSQAYILGGLGAPQPNMPTTPTGLAAGSLWRNGNVVNIV